MDEWTPWDGKRPFKGDRLIRVQYRNGVVSKQALPAKDWRGKWGAEADDWDIVAVAKVTA